MTIDKREHEAGNKILLAGSVSRTVGEWRGVLPLTAVTSCDLLHAHLHTVTTLAGLYSWMPQTAPPPNSTQTCLAVHLRNGRPSPLI